MPLPAASFLFVSLFSCFWYLRQILFLFVTYMIYLISLIQSDRWLSISLILVDPLISYFFDKEQRGGSIA